MSKKNKEQSEFWKKVHFKYRLSAINENTLEEVWKIKASIFSGAAIVLIVAFALIVVTSVIIIATPIRYYLPGYMDVEIREQAVKSAIKIDSLEHAMQFHDAYVSNIKNVLAGKLIVDSITRMDSVFVAEDDPTLEKSEPEREFTARYAEQEKYTLGVFAPSNISSGGLFYRPVKGVVIEQFNLNKKNYKIVIQTAQTESVLSSLEGTIIHTGYDVETSYTIQIQHKNGYISIYKGCTQLVKKVGDKVRTGEAIGVIEAEGNGDEKRGGRLIFELWNKGIPTNPETYITF